jgi:hypothetical protein
MAEAPIQSARESVRSQPTAASPTPGDALSSAVLNGDLERVSRMLLSGVGVDSFDSVSSAPCLGARRSRWRARRGLARGLRP